MIPVIELPGRKRDADDVLPGPGFSNHTQISVVQMRGALYLGRQDRLPLFAGGFHLPHYPKVLECQPDRSGCLVPRAAFAQTLTDRDQQFAWIGLEAQCRTHCTIMCRFPAESSISATTFWIGSPPMEETCCRRATRSGVPRNWRSSLIAIKRSSRVSDLDERRHQLTEQVAVRGKQWQEQSGQDHIEQCVEVSYHTPVVGFHGNHELSDRPKCSKHQGDASYQDEKVANRKSPRCGIVGNGPFEHRFDRGCPDSHPAPERTRYQAARRSLRRGTRPATPQQRLNPRPSSGLQRAAHPPAVRSTRHPAACAGWARPHSRSSDRVTHASRAASGPAR